MVLSKRVTFWDVLCKTCLKCTVRVLHVYMSYLRQLMVNMTCKIQNDFPDFYWYIIKKTYIIDGAINDQWGFFVKGNYVTYNQRKVTSVPFSWTFVDSFE